MALAALSVSLHGIGQNYCIPPPFTSGPFTGITKVTLDNFEHSTSFEDGYIYVNDEPLPKVTIGENSTVTIESIHTLVGTFSGNLNFRVWIDWNQDFDFDDTLETVLFVDEAFHTDGATATFEVPADALVGETRMRVYEDMLENEGHDYPVPCGYLGSPNFIGHHGESEDYAIEVLAPDTTTNQNEWPVGIAAAKHPKLMLHNDGQWLRWMQTEQTKGGAVLLNLHGAAVATGTEQLNVAQLASGIYVLSFPNTGARTKISIAK